MMNMPGTSYSGPIGLVPGSSPPAGVPSESESNTSGDGNASPEESPAEPSSQQTTSNDPADRSNEETTLLSTAERLERDVRYLSETIGERNLRRYDELCKATDFIEARFQKIGFKAKRQSFEVRGLDCFNVEAELKGSKLPNEIVIVGAHYDSVVGTPGANDNGSGTAAMLWLAEHFANLQPDRTIRFVAFTNEEPPYFQTDEMGSVVYAKACKANDENIVGAFSLETMGYYSDEKGSQKYPPGLAAFYPSEGNFVGFVANLGSRKLLNRTIKEFRDHVEFPSEGASLPSGLPGVGWSDHWSFWQEGYSGVMVTDTAPFRYPHYHLASDLPEYLDFERLAIVTEGMATVIENIATENE